MFDWVVTGAIVWVLVLLGGLVLTVLRSPDLTRRIVLTDTVVQLLLIALVLITLRQGEPYFVEAGLALALLSFVSSITIAAHSARRREEG